MVLLAAPMATITHAGFRRLVHSFADPHRYFSEMIHCPSLVNRGEFESWYLRTAPDSHKLIWQLTAPSIKSVAEAVKIVLDRGGVGLDFNMGCAAPAIVRTGAGSAWLEKDTHEVVFLLRTIMSIISQYSQKIPLSVKLRLNTTEEYSFLKDFVQLLVEEGVSSVTVHPRGIKSSYRQPAKHHFTAQLAQDVPIPVYGSGDIQSIADLARMNEQFPCAGWMIGRALVQKPWFFLMHHYAQTEGQKTPHTIDLLETGRLFLRLLTEEQPQAFWATRQKRFFSFFCDNLSFAHYAKTSICNAPTPEMAENVFTQYFNEVPDDRFIDIG